MMSPRWHVLLHIAPSSVINRTIEGVELGTICFFSLFPNLVLSGLARLRSGFLDVQASSRSTRTSDLHSDKLIRKVSQNQTLKHLVFHHDLFYSPSFF